MEGSAEVRLDDFPPLARVGFQEWRHRHEGVVGNQDVDRAEFLLHALHQGPHLLRVGHVAGHGNAGKLSSERGQLG